MWNVHPQRFQWCSMPCLNDELVRVFPKLAGQPSVEYDHPAGSQSRPVFLTADDDGLYLVRIGHRPICNRYMVRTSHARIAQCGDERSWIIGDALPVPRFYEDPGRLMGRRVLAVSGVESSQAAAVEQALFVRPQRRSDVQVELVVRRMLCAEGRERCSSDGWRVRAQRSARSQWAFRSVESTRKEPVTASGWNGSRFSPSIIVEVEDEPTE